MKSCPYVDFASYWIVLQGESVNTPDAITCLIVDIQYMWFFTLDVIGEKYYSFPLVKKIPESISEFQLQWEKTISHLSFQEKIIYLILYGNYCFP